MSLITNRRCTNITSFTKKHELLHACTAFPDLKLSKVLGEGSFGIVYLGEAKYDGKKIPLAVKFMTAKLSKKDFKNLNYEITYSYTMGAHGLGPKLYDAFYFVDPDGNYSQVIIMDYFKYNGIDSLEIATKKQATDIITQMIELLKEMIFVNRMYCVDIKPGNFVVNEDLNEVKLIDFGNDWCVPQKLMTKTESDLFQILIFQLYYLLIHNLCALTQDEIASIFCEYMSDDLPMILSKYYDDSANLTLAHYTDYSESNAVNMANYACPRKSRRKSQRRSPRKSPRKYPRRSPRRSPGSPNLNDLFE